MQVLQSFLAHFRSQNFHEPSSFQNVRISGKKMYKQYGALEVLFFIVKNMMMMKILMVILLFCFVSFYC